jgi:hypothetical protein
LPLFYHHFAPDIAGVATWVATFLAYNLVSCRRFSGR